MDYGLPHFRGNKGFWNAVPTLWDQDIRRKWASAQLNLNWLWVISLAGEVKN